MPKKSITKESWRPVLGFEALYEVSDLGNVRRLFARGHYRRLGLLATSAAVSGYPAVWLTDSEGKVRVRKIHRLVLESFVGPRPNGHECRHLDGNRRNAALSNLCWGSKKDNEADKLTHGTRLRGEQAPWASLTTEDIAEIRALAAARVMHKDIAPIYGIHKGTVSKIHLRTRWSHLQ